MIDGCLSSFISNWKDPSYTALRAEGFGVTRETYATLKKIEERSTEHRSPTCRLEVQKALHSAPLIFRYNNGDPVLYNPIANSIVCFRQACVT
jgi:hypothetical protein